jgi:glutaconate CoA-transferase subunit B
MEIAAWANRCYIITPHQKRRFPERVDFQTSIGFLSGGDARKKTGVRGGGPEAVVTNLGLLQPNEEGELVLIALHPGVTFEQVKENTGWDLKQSEGCIVTEPPTQEELRILREELDPGGIYI